MLKGRNKGFTLLELMIALTITAVVVVIIFGALRISIRAWEKGERDVDMRQKQRIVLDLIKRQLASTCAGDWERDPPWIPLRGDHKSVTFLSRVPMKPGQRIGLYYVQYAVKQDQNREKEHLTFYERDAALPDMRTGEGAADPVRFSELLPGMRSIEFEYLKDRPGERVSLWQKSWDPAVDQGVPRAIRITLREKDEKPPIYVIAAAGE